MISEQLLELLACPLCHEALSVESGPGGLLCQRCRLLFPVRNDIPVLLPDQARRVADPDPGVPGQ